jgi:hypothetical protein
VGTSNGNGNGNGHQPFVLPEACPIETRYGVVTPAQVGRILSLKRAGRSNASIETEVFPQANSGGAAYYKVKAVLDFYRNGGASGLVE